MGLAPKRRGDDFDFVENEIAVFGATRSFPVEGKGVEAEGGEIGLGSFEEDGVGVFFRRWSGELDGPAFDFGFGSGGRDLLDVLGDELSL